MPTGVDLRAELAVGRHALVPGRVPEIAEWICGRPRRIPGLVELLWDDDAGVANRAADVLERIFIEPSPALRRAVQEFKEPLLGLLAEARFIKLRWNLALILPRLELTVAECRRVAPILRSWLDDPSSIIKTAALHGLASLTRQDPAGIPAVIDLLRVASRTGTPAMRARSRHLLAEFENPRPKKRRHTLEHFYV